MKDLETALKNEEDFYRRLAREKQGFYKGQTGFYIATLGRGDDTILRRNKRKSTSFYDRMDCEKLLAFAAFSILELGYPGMQLLDLAQIQMHDVIAGSFESRELAVKVLPYVVNYRYSLG